MGNCTVTIKQRLVADYEVIADVALSSSYATGGDTVTLASLGANQVLALETQGGATTPGGHAVEVVSGATPVTAPKLRVRDAATGAELANASNNSAQSVRVVAKVDFPYV